ncbi:MAG: hypothetical protein ACXW5J_22635 [Thermoanaerobaculia bacterium]
MTTTAPRRSFLMQYRAEDFALYLLGLLLAGLLITPALPHPIAQAAFLASLAYLAIFFVIRHGAKFEPSVIRASLEGIARYPGMLLRNWWTARSAIIPIALIFVLAVTTESMLSPGLVGTRWLKPFPWPWVIWTAFLIVTLFRIVILVAHLLRASVVREVLERSTQKSTIRVFSITNHIFQAFVTGMVAHLSVVAPCVLFFMWTDPTNLREALLIAGFAIWTAIARPLRKRGILEKPGILSHRLVYENHKIAHQSRFFFAVFHGHHHDAIPSALIGSAGGTGFFENVDRALTWLEPMTSIVVKQFGWAYGIAFDMVVHQYIPGVFPFAKITVIGRAHHVTHHFGSALPLGLIYDGYIEPRDMENGYKPDNVLTRWFLGEVERLEGLDPELGRKFLSLNDYALPQTSAPTPDAATVPAQA